jgi:hypothetical protein
MTTGCFGLGIISQNLGFVACQVTHERVQLGQTNRQALGCSERSSGCHEVRLTSDPSKPHTHKVSLTQRGQLSPFHTAFTFGQWERNGFVTSCSQ